MQKEESAIRKIMKYKSLPLILVTVLFIIVFYLCNHNYLGTDNIKGIMNGMSLSGMICVGTACLLIGGGVDLASGAEACFGGVICALLLQAGMSWVPAVILAVLFGCAMGAFNVLFINVLSFPGFIVTIAMSSVYSGLINVITNVQNVAISNQSFYALGSTVLFNILPLPFVIVIVLLLIYGYILTYTSFGRACYLCGGNPVAARLSGLNPKKITTILYINNAALASFAGIVLSARMHAASPTAAASSSLDSITAAVLGGVSFTGGAGGMGGCFIGLLLLKIFSAGLTTINLQSYWKVVAQGVLLIIALVVDYFNEKRRIKELKQKAQTKE